jgi:hypothetical protein
VTTVNSIESEVSRTSAFISYGVTNRLDVSIAVPFVTADLLVTSDAAIQRIGTTNPETHFFRSLEDDIGARRRFTAFGSASGLGDLTVRLKQNVKKAANQGVALGIDLRLPTGDERNLLGTGAPGVNPFVAWSGNYGAISPHLNAGYQWNGDSILGGEPGSGEANDLPDLAQYSAGAVIEVHPRVTAAVDVVGRYIIDSPRLRLEEFHALDNQTVYSNITFTSGSFHEISAAAGVKINTFGRMLLNLNLLVRLNSAGLRDKISPLVGLEYAF